MLTCIRKEASTAQLVVLDDDPTGTQTVHGIPVLTTWEVETLIQVLGRDWPVIYILTNSRSMAPIEAEKITRQVAKALTEVSSRTGKSLRVLSRSDSTLRGHFPLETDVLAAELAAAGPPIGRLLLVPAFIEGGRYTLSGTHYLQIGDELVPTADTEFALDASFGYRTSYLPDWVAEKSGERIQASQVTVISLDEIRKGGPEHVASRLLNASEVVSIDALSYRDLEVVALAAVRAESLGNRFLFRTGASFVRVLAGLPELPLLSPQAAVDRQAEAGGLCIVGSYVERSSDQLARLLSLPGVKGIELRAESVQRPEQAEAEIQTVASDASAALIEGEDVVIFSSRKVLKGGSQEENLAICRRVSLALTGAVARIAVRPRFFIAKGGISSHDVATRSLGVRVALVLGQVLPGVPVWELGSETRFPGLPYVVFPGNVGGPDALATLVQSMRSKTVLS